MLHFDLEYCLTHCMRGRILTLAAMEAMECGGTGIMNLQCLKSFGWCGVGSERVQGLAIQRRHQSYAIDLSKEVD